jgi:probable O-glycosylation ligase (exosortase A-associated)
MAVFFWWKGKHKLPVLFVTLFAVAIAVPTMPEKWYSRMETIKTYREDSSASMRLNAWGAMWNLAKDRPLVGGGFEVATDEVYARYSPSRDFPPQVAHSIYFQALGEHGFVGLALYLLLLAMTWRSASAVIRMARERPSVDLAWARDFALMLQVALVGFAVGGAFLSLVNFDVPYYLIGIMAAMLTIAAREANAKDTAAISIDNPPGRPSGPVTGPAYANQ